MVLKEETEVLGDPRLGAGDKAALARAGGFGSSVVGEAFVIATASWTQARAPARYLQVVTGPRAQGSRRVLGTLLGRLRKGEKVPFRSL